MKAGLLIYGRYVTLLLDMDCAVMMKLILRADIVKRSIWIALIVGTILNIINQGDRVIDDMDINLAKFLLTYMVPYCVATYSSIMVILK